MFEQYLRVAFDLSIPLNKVTPTDHTKPWMTLLVKHFINQRWRAYHERKFSRYNHLKQKVKKEIEKSKMIWSRNLRVRNIWKMSNKNGLRKSKQLNEILVSTVRKYRVYYWYDKHEINWCLLWEENWRYSLVSFQVYKMLQKLPNRKASADVSAKLYKAAAFWQCFWHWFLMNL